MSCLYRQTLHPNSDISASVFAAVDIISIYCLQLINWRQYKLCTVPDAELWGVEGSEAFL